MDILFGAFAVLFVLDVALLLWPWRVVTLTQLSIIVAASLSWSLLVISDGAKIDILSGLAISGLTWLTYACFRLIRAWADRTEAANMLPLHPRR